MRSSAIEEDALSDEAKTPAIAGRMPVVTDLEPGTYYWCACGRSRNQPFCDGSHAGTAFTPVPLEIPETRRVALCTCKHSAKAPLCDGTHSRLPR